MVCYNGWSTSIATGLVKRRAALQLLPLLQKRERLQKERDLKRQQEAEREAQLEQLRLKKCVALFNTLCVVQWYGYNSAGSRVIDYIPYFLL